eukprot:jgi/Psemu1/64040/estExt_Genemark1.C_480051
MKLLAKQTLAVVGLVKIAISMMTMASTGVSAFVGNAQRTQTAMPMPMPSLHESTVSKTFSTANGTPSFFALDRRQKPTTTTTTALPAVTAAAAAAALLPGPFAAAAVIPTCLGLWRTGFAVSYGYGGAMLASGLVQLAASLRGVSSAMILPLQLHAALYVFYGVRLCGFLFHRQKTSPVGGMKRRDDTLAQRLKRLPLILGCSALYYCMAAPAMKILALDNPAPTISNAAALAVGIFGFGLAAVGDWYKSKIKARDGADTLVTSGPFRYFRHPNYTGEMIGWTSACILLPALSLIGSSNLRRAMPLFVSSILGWAGIVFAVLAVDATAGLEKKQRAKYGGTPEYEAWVKSSWSGPMLGKVDGDVPKDGVAPSSSS